MCQFLKTKAGFFLNQEIRLVPIPPHLPPSALLSPPPHFFIYVVIIYVSTNTPDRNSSEACGAFNCLVISLLNFEVWLLLRVLQSNEGKWREKQREMKGRKGRVGKRREKRQSRMMDGTMRGVLHSHDKRVCSLMKVVCRLESSGNQTCCQRSWESQKNSYLLVYLQSKQRGWKASRESSVPASPCSEGGGPGADGHRHWKQQKDEAAERSVECVLHFPFFHFELHSCSQPTVASDPHWEADLSHGVTDPRANLLWKHHHRSVFCQFSWYLSQSKPPIL